MKFTQLFMLFTLFTLSIGLANLGLTGYYGRYNHEGRITDGRINVYVNAAQQLRTALRGDEIINLHMLANHA